jgi:hypothetical protein
MVMLKHLWINPVKKAYIILSLGDLLIEDLRESAARKYGDSRRCC